MNRLRFRQARDKGACGARIIVDFRGEPSRGKQSLEGTTLMEKEAAHSALRLELTLCKPTDICSFLYG